MLILSPTKPELGIFVAHLDVRREEFTGGDETWWIGDTPIVSAQRKASLTEARRIRAAKELGVVEGATYKGKCTHVFFKAYDISFEFGKVRKNPYLFVIIIVMMIIIMSNKHMLVKLNSCTHLRALLGIFY
jgi:hypothetical protein